MQQHIKLLLLLFTISIELEVNKNNLEPLSKNKELLLNPFQKFHKETAIVTGGTKDDFNSLVAGWGQMGVLWQKPVITVYVKPERYTWQFLEKGEYFTVSFLKRKFRKKLGFIGMKSGRDIKNKEKEAGLHIINKGPGLGIIFEESIETYVCKLIYKHAINYNMIHEEIKKFYESGVGRGNVDTTPHSEYIGEIIATYFEKGR